VILDPGAVAEVVRAAGELRPLAIGIATVELDRAALELEAADSGLTFAAAADDELLGARCLVSAGVLAVGGADVRVVLLEPSTEGLLAAALARRGEGPAVVYAAPAEASPDAPGPRSKLGAGPLGPGRLVVGSRFGPHVIVLAGSLEGSPGRHGRNGARP